MIPLVFLLVTTYVFVPTTSIPSIFREQPNGLIKLCGTHLDQVLYHVCNGKFFGQNYKKKTSGLNFIKYLKYFEGDNGNYPDEYFENLNDNFRKKKNIYENDEEANGSNENRFNEVIFKENWVYPFQLKDFAHMMIPRRFRRDTGIVEECCQKSCSYNEMKSYCA